MIPDILIAIDQYLAVAGLTAVAIMVASLLISQR